MLFEPHEQQCAQVFRAAHLEDLIMRNTSSHEMSFGSVDRRFCFTRTSVRESRGMWAPLCLNTHAARLSRSIQQRPTGRKEGREREIERSKERSSEEGKNPNKPKQVKPTRKPAAGSQKPKQSGKQDAAQPISFKKYRGLCQAEATKMSTSRNVRSKGWKVRHTEAESV